MPESPVQFNNIKLPALSSKYKPLCHALSAVLAEHAKAWAGLNNVLREDQCTFSDKHKYTILIYVCLPIHKRDFKWQVDHKEAIKVQRLSSIITFSVTLQQLKNFSHGIN